MFKFFQKNEPILLKKQMPIMLPNFIVISAIAAVLSYFLYKQNYPHAIILDFFESFRFKSLFAHLGMKRVPSTWPNDIHSYVYDFSVVFGISEHLDVIKAKPEIMPDNILPYGPLAFLFFRGLAIFDIQSALIIYRIISVSLFIFALWLALAQFQISTLKRLGIIVFLCCICTPLSIVVIAGNIEVFLFSLCLIGLCINKKRPYFAATLFAVCVSIKYYPIIFLLEFLKDRQFKPFVYASVLSAILWLTPFFVLEGTFIQNLQFTLDQIKQSSRLCTDNAAVYCSTGGLSIALFFFNFKGLSLDLQHLFYQITSLVIGLSGLYCYFKIKERTLALTGLITVICLIPQVSVFYKLLYLFIPLLLISNEIKPLSRIILSLLIACCLSGLPFYIAMNVSGVKADFSSLVLLIHVVICYVAYKQTPISSSIHPQVVS